MRSRDGNRTFSLRLCSLILFSSLALNASEYLISYSYIVKDAMLFDEELLISKAMKKCTGTPKESFIFDTDGGKDLDKIIQNQKEEFIEYIHKLGLHLNHKDETKNYQYRSRTKLTLKTTCFKVDFNDNFARISPLK